MSGGESSTQAVNVRLTCEPYAVPLARRAVDRVSHMTRPVGPQLSLLISEVVTNSVRHSQGAAPDLIDVTVRVSDEVVRAEITDPGTGFEPGPAEPKADRTGGWGLYLIDRLADRWGVRHEPHTQVWFELDRRRTLS